jgi:type 1 fimbria pilin
MMRNRKRIIALIGMLFSAGNVNALPLSSKITINGGIGANTCVANWNGGNGGSSIAIPMGNKIQGRKKGNTLVTLNTIRFSMMDCQLEHGIYASWSGIADNDNPTLFQIGGSAAGVAIEIDDKAYWDREGKITPGEEVQYHDQDGLGNVIMDFQPSLVQTQDEVSTGTIDTTITVNFRYE